MSTDQYVGLHRLDPYEWALGPLADFDGRNEINPTGDKLWAFLSKAAGVTRNC